MPNLPSHFAAQPCRVRSRHRFSPRMSKHNHAHAINRTRCAACSGSSLAMHSRDIRRRDACACQSQSERRRQTLCFRFRRCHQKSAPPTPSTTSSTTIGAAIAATGTELGQPSTATVPAPTTSTEPSWSAANTLGMPVGMPVGKPVGKPDGAALGDGVSGSERGVPDGTGLGCAVRAGDVEAADGVAVRGSAVRCMYTAPPPARDAFNMALSMERVRSADATSTGTASVFFQAAPSRSRGSTHPALGALSSCVPAATHRCRRRWRRWRRRRRRRRRQAGTDDQRHSCVGENILGRRIAAASGTHDRRKQSQ